MGGGSQGEGEGERFGWGGVTLGCDRQRPGDRLDGQARITGLPTLAMIWAQSGSTSASTPLTLWVTPSSASVAHWLAEGVGDGVPPGRPGSAKERTRALPATEAGTPGRVLGASSCSAQAKRAARDWVGVVGVQELGGKGNGIGGRVGAVRGRDRRVGGGCCRGGDVWSPRPRRPRPESPPAASSASTCFSMAVAGWLDSSHRYPVTGGRDGPGLWGVVGPWPIDVTAGWVDVRSAVAATDEHDTRRYGEGHSEGGRHDEAAMEHP